MPNQHDDALRCSFCKKMQHEVKGLMVGESGDVYICNECVEICVEIFGDKVEIRRDEDDKPNS